MLDRFRSFLQRREAKILLPLLAAGILLLIFSGQKSKKAGNTEESGALSAYEDRLTEEVREVTECVEFAGECRVMIAFSGGFSRTYSGGKLVREEPPEVLGVTVVCEGGERSDVQSELTEMLTALFGIGANRVAILPAS